MLLRLRLILLGFGGALLLLITLCLGSQNLNERQSIRLASFRSMPLPSGVLIGLSLVIGVVSGTSAVALMLPEERQANQTSL